MNEKKVFIDAKRFDLAIGICDWYRYYKLPNKDAEYACNRILDRQSNRKYDQGFELSISEETGLKLILEDIISVAEEAKELLAYIENGEKKQNEHI